jgi:hypothetical protein
MSPELRKVVEEAMRWRASRQRAFRAFELDERETELYVAVVKLILSAEEGQ